MYPHHAVPPPLEDECVPLVPPPLDVYPLAGRARMTGYISPTNDGTCSQCRKPTSLFKPPPGAAAPSVIYVGCETSLQGHI